MILLSQLPHSLKRVFNHSLSKRVQLSGMYSFGEPCHKLSGEAEMAKRNVSLSGDF